MYRSNDRYAARRRLPRAVMGALIAAGLGVAGAQAKDPEPPKLIWDQDTLTGDWGGARTTLKDKWGIDFSLTYIGETLGVLSGGLHRRASYEGRGDLSVTTDLEKMVGWTGGSTHVTVYNIHNGNYFNAVDNVGSIADPSNIDARATTRLFHAWFQQNFFNDRISIRMGELAADEFFNSDTAGGLINGTFGWASILGSNMTSGGPSYPLATPGARIAVKPTDQLTVQAAVFSGDPAGRHCDEPDNPQKCNAHGTAFSFSGGSLWMGEVQFALNQGEKDTGLASLYKVGTWYATTSFASQHYGIDSTGALVSLGVDDTAKPIKYRGDWGIYGVADQMIWRGPASSVSLFARGGFSPSQRNLISYYADGGIGFKGLIPSLPNDTLTFGVAYAKISPDSTGADQDALAFNGPPYAVRHSETVYELSYIRQITKWWSIQPDLQYIVRPNGGQNADDPTLTVRNAFVVGVRTTVKF